MDEASWFGAHRMTLTMGQLAFTLVLYAIAIGVLGLALFPGALLCYAMWTQTAGIIVWQRLLWLCFAGAAAYFLFGLSLIVLTAAVRMICRLDLREGEYTIVSAGGAKWFVSNALQLLVWTTFGDCMLLTPFAALFYRLMGAKLGRNVQINSKFCADLSLLEIGDGSVIGGHATVIGHSFEPKGLILKRVKIGRKAVIGLNAVLLPGVEVGDEAVVAAGVVVPKHTKIEPGTVYFGLARDGQQTRTSAGRGVPA